MMQSIRNNILHATQNGSRQQVLGFGAQIRGKIFGRGKRYTGSDLLFRTLKMGVGDDGMLVLIKRNKSINVSLRKLQTGC